MSDDLISRKEVIAIIRDIEEMLKIPCENGGYGDNNVDNSSANSIRNDFAEKVIDFLSAVPTAYDVDKVVEQMKEDVLDLIDVYCAREPYIEFENLKSDEMENIERIVRSGGVDE